MESPDLPLLRCTWDPGSIAFPAKRGRSLLPPPPAPPQLVPVRASRARLTVEAAVVMREQADRGTRERRADELAKHNLSPLLRAAARERAPRAEIASPNRKRALRMLAEESSADAIISSLLAAESFADAVRSTHPSAAYGGAPPASTAFTSSAAVLPAVVARSAVARELRERWAVEHDEAAERQARIALWGRMSLSPRRTARGRKSAVSSLSASRVRPPSVRQTESIAASAPPEPPPEPAKPLPVYAAQLVESGMSPQRNHR
eukprot:TRINITY_DN21960_c0_g1_i1.p1 TRINITY_DN21960_c0_g1~~TRINITY_DN21960_c0_g1_i1.p1  ORF type:complete len:275 (+),score=86.36 TRINITY_DN21960_c0_g1_i1:42-827(+)